MKGTATWSFLLGAFELTHFLDTEKIAVINLLKPTGHVMHQQFNIQQLYVLPTLFMCFVFI